MEKNNEQVKNIWKPLCLVLAALLALSWVFFGFLYSKGGVDFSTLENPKQNYTASGGAIIGESTGNGVALMSAKIAPEDFAANDISPMAETAYTLTATITPDNADDKTVDWSVAFVNPASEWATGKTVTDYVTVTPTSNGALTATVECLQAFGEQVVVTVASRDNEGVTATCTVDYVKKVNGMELTLKKGEEVVTAFDIYRTMTSYSFIPTVQWSDGTIEYDSTYYYIDILTNYDLVDAFDAEGISMRPLPSNQVDHQPFNDPDNGAYKYSTGYSILARFYGVDTASRDQFFEKLSSWDGALFYLKIYVKAYFVDGGEAEEVLGDFYCDESVSILYYAQEFDIGVGTVDVGVSAADVTLDQSAVVL